MEQLKAFIIKFIGIGVLTFSIFGIFFHATIGRLLLMTLVVSTITFIGDLFILPRINKAVAAIADFATFFLLYLLLGNLVVEGNVSLILPAFTAAYLGAAAEAVFHIYMMDRVHEPDRSAPIPTRFQTEIADESDVEAATKLEQERKEK
ncbi:DUF2512 family protein [Pseudogracilibacillus sp. SO30301A]|uniref:DUF2512 family protein n=1 Tax=Pseudogracilibacillus sp. SO30301A TaxID=3098291 RepID=UPI00300DF8BC